MKLLCLLSVEEEAVQRVVTVSVPLDERVSALEAELDREIAAVGFRKPPNKVMKLYCVQKQRRLTYRLDARSKLEVLLFDGEVLSGHDASSDVVLQHAEHLAPWVKLSWHFHDRPFTFPDVVDVVVVWGEDEDNEEEAILPE